MYFKLTAFGNLQRKKKGIICETVLVIKRWHDTISVNKKIEATDTLGKIRIKFTEIKKI